MDSGGPSVLTTIGVDPGGGGGGASTHGYRGGFRGAKYTHGYRG